MKIEKEKAENAKSYSFRKNNPKKSSKKHKEVRKVDEGDGPT